MCGKLKEHSWVKSTGKVVIHRLFRKTVPCEMMCTTMMMLQGGDVQFTCSDFVVSFIPYVFSQHFVLEVNLDSTLSWCCHREILTRSTFNASLENFFYNSKPLIHLFLSNVKCILFESKIAIKRLVHFPSLHLFLQTKLDQNVKTGTSFSLHKYKRQTVWKM